MNAYLHNFWYFLKTLAETLFFHFKTCILDTSHLQFIHVMSWYTHVEERDQANGEENAECHIGYYISNICTHAPSRYAESLV